jgi:hypothetical protein
MVNDEGRVADDDKHEYCRMMRIQDLRLHKRSRWFGAHRSHTLARILREAVSNEGIWSWQGGKPVLYTYKSKALAKRGASLLFLGLRIRNTRSVLWVRVGMGAMCDFFILHAVRSQEIPLQKFFEEPGLADYKTGSSPFQ